MFSAEAVVDRYEYISGMYSLLAFGQHVVLGLVAALVVQGNKRPGHRLMSLAFASMCLSVFYISQQFGLRLASVTFLVLMFCAGYDVVRPQTNWSKGMQRPLWIRRCAYGAIVWGWLYPHHVTWWKVPMASSLGLLPSPTLMVMLGLLWLAFPETNRLLHWAAALIGALFGLYGVLYLHIPSDVVLLGIAGISIQELYKATREGGGWMEDELPPEKEEKRPPASGARKDQIWRI